MEFWKRKKEKTSFLRNGSMFLEKLIADCNGRSNPIRMFSSDQIYKATNHLDLKCSLTQNFTDHIWYKGVIEGRLYAIKRHTREYVAYNDVVLSARVSNHSGFLKLIGCCLEYPLPVLVFEDLDYRALNKRGTLGILDAPLLPWKVRLKIAKEVAIAITYLHTAFPRIIIHRNIKATNVFLDKNGKTKLTDLSEAITLPEGKSWILDGMVAGAYGYLDPNYYKTDVVTEYADVFCFGILMLVLLTGKSVEMDTAKPDTDTDWKFLKNVKDLQKRGEPVEVGGDSNDTKPDQMKMLRGKGRRQAKDDLGGKTD